MNATSIYSDRNFRIVFNSLFSPNFHSKAITKPSRFPQIALNSISYFLSLSFLPWVTAKYILNGIPISFSCLCPVYCPCLCRNLHFLRLNLSFINAGVPNLQKLMPDDLRWSWCNHNRNKIHNKCDTLESFQNKPTPFPWKTCLLQNWSLVSKSLGTAANDTPLVSG